MSPDTGKSCRQHIHVCGLGVEAGGGVDGIEEIAQVRNDVPQVILVPFPLGERSREVHVASVRIHRLGRKIVGVFGH